jgi:tRNA(Ile)-lysidine synthase
MDGFSRFCDGDMLQTTRIYSVDTAKTKPDNSMPVLKRMADTINRHDMLVPGDRVLVGVSGGADSVALLHLMLAMKPVLDLELAVAHLNHGLRAKASDQDARFVEKLADKLGLQCYCDKIALDTRKGSIEERARSARYAYFNRLLTQHDFTKLALGHQADDNAEATLLHILRGSGIRGLSGIPPKRDKIIRPLIEVRRADITAYLSVHRISYVEDASNTDLRFRRNRIRHQLIPLLQDHYNPNITAALNRMAGLCRDEQNWLNSILQPQLEKARIASEPARLELRADILIKLPHAVQRRLIRMAMRKWMGNLRRLGVDHIEAVIELLHRNDTGCRLSLPQKVTVERTMDGLQFVNDSTMLENRVLQAPKFQYSVPYPKDEVLTIHIPEADSYLNLSTESASSSDMNRMSRGNTVWFDLDMLSFPLIVRSVEPGDRLAPFGMPGTQKVKKVLIDRKIPRNQRGCIPIVAQGDTILWIAGIRRAAAAPISVNTKRVLRIEIS